MNKKTTWGALALFIALSAFTMSADFGGKKDLIGRWMPEKAVIGDQTEEFDLSDGKERSVEFMKDGKYQKDGKEEGGGTWTLSDKKLTLTGGRFAGEWTIKELNKKRLTMSMMRGGQEATLYMIPYKKPKKKD